VRWYAKQEDAHPHRIGELQQWLRRLREAERKETHTLFREGVEKLIAKYGP
jgi:hypothetical protein